jgi:sugar lactone lactonase YvrE
MRTVKQFLMGVCALILSSVTVAQAQTSPEVTRGLTWLKSQIQIDGTLNPALASIATAEQGRAETLQTLTLLGATSNALAAKVAAAGDTGTEYLARRAIALSLANQPQPTLIADLLARMNADGGVGAHSFYTSNPLDTAFLLLALKAANSTDTTSINKALGYLTQSKNTAGAWGVQEQDRAYVTAYVLLAADAWKANFSVATITSPAKDWLLTQRTTGQFGSVMLNAVSLLALATQTNDNTVLQPLTTALKTAQDANGSWSNDPYGTALALRALWFVGQSAPPATTGEVLGTVVDDATNQSLADATVQIVENTSLSTTSVTSGTFSLTGIPAGSYTLRVSKLGYDAKQATLQIVAGQSINLGAVRLKVSSFTATVSGVVKDQNGTALADVLVSVGTGSAITNATGQYQIAGIAAGSGTITVAKTNYQTVTATVGFEAGKAYIFSPTLYYVGYTPAAPSLKGKVIDGITNAAISGATVTLGQSSKTTLADGTFEFTALTAGTFNLTVSANTYQSVTVTGSLVAGPNNIGNIALGKAAATSSISGIVADASTNAPIAGATVAVQGSALTATSGADGKYAIAGITTTSFKLLVSAAGYLTSTQNVSLQQVGAAVLDLKLTKSQPSGITLESFKTNKPVYLPNDELVVEVELRNTQTAAVDVVVETLVIDAQNSIALELKANAKGLGANPPNLPISLGAAAVRLVPMSKFLNRQASGSYTAVVRVYDANGLVIAEGRTPFSVTAAAILGGGLIIDPPLTQVGTNVPVRFTAQVGNVGNQAIPAGDLELTVTLATPDNQTSTVPQTQVRTLASGINLKSTLGMAVDAAGNVYTVSYVGNDGRIFRTDPQGQVTVVATVPASETPYLVDIAIDADGNFWVPNFYYSKVFRVTPAGVVTSVKVTQLNTLRGIDIDGAGNLILTGELGSEYRVIKRTPQGVETVLWSNGLNQPFGMVRDSQGNLVISNYGDNTLSKVDSAGAIRSFATGLSRPQGLAIDGAGNFYVANSGDNTVAKVAPDGTVTTFATGFNQPSDVKLDASGNVFVSNTGDNSIIKISSAGAKEVFARGVANYPTGLAYDAAGNLYIANTDGTLRQKTPQNDLNILATGLSSPQGVAVDAVGAIFVANSGSGTVTKHVGANKTTFATGLLSPYGIAIEPAGSLYVSERGLNRISRFDSNGGALAPVWSPVTSPTEVRIDSAGKVFVLNTDSISVIEAGIPRTLVTNFTSVRAITPDTTSGGLVVLKGYDVYRISAAGVPTLVKSLPFYPYGVGVATGGNIVIGDYSNKRVQLLDAAGNLTILATLPNYVRQVVTDFAGNIFALTDYSIYRVNLDGSFSVFVTLTEYMYWISTTADNQLLTWTNYSKIYSLNTTTGAATVVQSNTSANGATRDASGQLWASFSSENRIVAYNTSGAEVARVDGFYYPLAIVWTGSELQFLDSYYRLFKMPVGGLPTRIGQGFYAGYLAMRNGVLHGTYSSSIVRWTGTQSETVTSVGNSASLYGIATRADGTLSVADNSNSRVVTFNSSNAVVEDFAGIVSPKGLAFDGTGRLHVANTGSNTIARFDASSRIPKLLVRISGPKFLAFEPTGNLLVSNNSSVSRIDAQGTITSVEDGRYMEAVAADASGIYGVESSASTIRKFNGTKFQPFAVGLSLGEGVRVASDGSIYIASRANNTVVKLASNQLGVVATDLTSPHYLDIDSTGKIYVVGDQGTLSQIAPNGVVTDLPVGSLLNKGRLFGVGVRPDGKLIVADYDYYNGSLFEISVTQAVAPPPVGTVVYRTTASVNTLVPSEDRTLVNFGSWLPPFGGDFIAEVRRAGVAGMATNYLHVGPFASSKLATLKSEVPPGDQTVPLQLKISGADFTSISRVETALIKPTVEISFPNGMAADKAGNILFTDGTTLKKTTPGGVTSTLLSGLNTRFGLAADSQERFYLPNYDGATSKYQLLRVLPDGTKTVVADLGTTTVNGIAVNSRDEIMVGTVGKLLKVNPDTGAISIISSAGLPSPRGIAIDGRDNVYVQNENHFVAQIKPDGSATTVFSKGDGIDDPIFEGDGYPNIAADCADNFYIATSQWKKINQAGEEHIVAQVIPRTGRIAALFDGLQISSSLNDIDYLSYDRFGNRLLMWNHGDSKIWTVPVTCGAISVEAHIVTKPGQILTGFSTTPSASVPLADGRTDYVWSLRDVTTSGATIAFDTILKGLKLGDLASVADSGYTLFKNSFSPTDVRVPLDIPTVRVSNLVSLNVATDKGDYSANATADISSTLVNAFTRTIGGNLTIEVLDKTGSRIAIVTQQGVVIPASGTIPVTAPFPIGSLTPAQYTVKATLVDNGIEQAKAQSTFNVLPDNVSASAKSSVVTDKTKYNPTDRVLITSRLVSQSANVNLDNLTLMVRVYDPSNQLLFTHGHVVAQLLAGATREFSVTQPLTNGTQGTYTVRQELLDSQNRVIDQSQTTYDIGASSSTGFGLSGTVTATPKEVRVGEAVALTGTVTNSGNSIITNLPLTVRVVDPDRTTTVVEYPVTAASIAVSGSFTVPANTWTANVRPNATYLAVLVATVGTGASATQQTLATDTIKVIPQIANTITATAGTPQSAKLSQPYTNALEATVRDTAGNPFAGATVTFSAPATGASAAFSGAASGVTDAAGKVRVNVTANATAGGFTVSASTPGVTANASFVLTNTALSPPTITFVSPANNTSVNAPGSFALTASVTTPDSTVSKVEFFNGASLLGTGTLTGSNYVYNWTNVVLGEYPNVTARVTDNKNQTATTSALRLIVAGCGTAAPFAFTPQQNVPLSTAITSNTITVTGITCPVDISVTGGEISINNAAFTAAASTVKLNDTVRVRVTSSNENSKAVSALVTIGTIKGSFVVTTLSKADVTQSVLNEARILVLVSCPSSSGKSASATSSSETVDDTDSAMTKSLTKAADKDEDDDSTCAKSRKVFVDDYLTSLGVEFMTVTNVVDFKRELRCGKYNTYWISGGFAKLKGTLDDELAEAVSRGESLIVDGVHDTRNKLIDEVSGAKYTGVISGNDHQVVLSGAVMPTGTFASKGRAAKTTFTGATVHGLFDTATSTNTAIASDAYGLGKALTFAFDWVATAQQAASAVTAKEAMKRGISLIAPSAPTDLTPNEYVRFKTSIANPAATAGTFEIAATLPPAAVFASSVPAPTSITGNVAKWRITAPASGSADVVYSFRTPTQDSVQPVATTISSVVDTTLTEIAAKSTPLAVIGYATRSAAIKTQIEALNPTPAAEKQARDKAVTYLIEATTKRTANSLQDAIEALLKVQGELDRVASLNTQTVQVQVGLLIKTVEREFCLSGQTESYCTATASFSSNGAFTDVDSNDGNLKLIRVRGGGPGSPTTGTLGGVWRVGSFIKQGVTEVKAIDNFTTYTSGKIYNWTFEYKGNGKTIFTLLDPARPATIVTQNDRWIVKNALKFSVHADAGIGANFKIESNILTLNGAPLTDGKIITNSNNLVSDISKVLAGPSLKQPFIVTGTVILTFPPPAPVPGDKLYFQINGGEAPCADDEEK